MGFNGATNMIVSIPQNWAVPSFQVQEFPTWGNPAAHHLKPGKPIFWPNLILKKAHIKGIHCK